MSVIMVPENTLITATLEERRQLTMKMARLVVKATQPDEEIRINYAMCTLMMPLC